MSMHRRQHRGAAALAGLALVLIPLGGCGGSGSSGSSRIIYKGPEEVDQKKADLKAAMEGGAYGSSGRRSAPKMGP